MFELIIPPALILLIGAFLVAVVQPALRPVIALAAPLATLYAIWQVPDGILLSATFLGYEVQLIEGGPLRRLFATVFAIMAFAGALFSFKQAKWYELAAAMAYASGATYVARWTILHVRDLIDSIEQALTKKGFSFVEILSPCPVNYGRRNKETPIKTLQTYHEKAIIKNFADPSELDIDFEKGFVLGTFVDKDRATCGDQYDKVCRLQE